MTGPLPPPLRPAAVPPGPPPSRLQHRPRVRYYSRANFERIPQVARLSPEVRQAIRVVSAVLPFKVNGYVVDQLIDWERAPDDPMFRLAFPRAEMLDPRDFARVADLLARRAPAAELHAQVSEVRRRLNPDPGEQRGNVPLLHGAPLAGVQHKYPETVLFFPAEGQTCHSYCSFCFRWPQFVGEPGWRFESRRGQDLVEYLRLHREISDVLITGGDPLTMPAGYLRRYLEPLLAPELDHVSSLRVATKSLTYWPFRFYADEDSADLLDLFAQVGRRGRHLALMAHVNHPRELEAPATQAAIRRLRDAGCEIRCQAPILRGINDSPGVWEELWRLEVRLGCIPYYAFVERDTGPRGCFEVPLNRCWEIFRAAWSRVSGLARTVRGPVMSVSPGKVCVDGVARVAGSEVFALRFLQHRDRERVGRPFFAAFDPEACWWDALRPAFEHDAVFFR